MHPHLTAALACLDAAGHELHAAVDAIPASLHATKPAPDRWSVNDVLEHLSRVETFFVTTILEKLSSAQAAGLTAEAGQPQMLSAELKSALTDRSTPRMAPEHAHPTGTVDAATALETIDAGHRRLRDALTSASGLALSTVTHEHRLFGTLNLYQWVELIAGHEERHTAQLREIARQVSTV